MIIFSEKTSSKTDTIAETKKTPSLEEDQRQKVTKETRNACNRAECWSAKFVKLDFTLTIIYAVMKLKMHNTHYDKNYTVCNKFIINQKNIEKTHILYVCMHACMITINIAFSLQVIKKYSITCWSNEQKCVLVDHKKKCFIIALPDT